MPRYYFRISNGKPYTDETGVELRDELYAWKEAKQLARDIEYALELDGKWNLDVSDSSGPLFSITITAQRLR
jgi:Domain of unknown function (DUF6894)